MPDDRQVQAPFEMRRRKPLCVSMQTGTVAIKQRQRQGVGHGTRRRLNTLFDSAWTEPLPIYV